MALKDELPQIVQTELQGESKSIRALVKFLLNQVMSTQQKANKETIIKTALSDEIEKMYNAGLFRDEEEL